MNNYPWYREWQRDLSKKGVTLLGVHTPETPGEAKIERIRDKVKQHRLTFPIAVDSRSTNWKRWRNQFWPAVYLIDKQGQVRYLWNGELNFNGSGGHRVMRQKIEELLAEKR